jgi:hypothetical protein
MGSPHFLTKPFQSCCASLQKSSQISLLFGAVADVVSFGFP